MKGVTHMAVGMASSILVAKVVQPPLVGAGIDTTALLLISGAVGGLLPDIDHSGSKLGSKIPILPKLLKHRGITHTIYFIAFCALIMNYLGVTPIYILTTSCAIFMHIIGDMLTPAGIDPFKLGNVFTWHFCFPILKIPLLERGIEIGSYMVVFLLLS